MHKNLLCIPLRVCDQIQLDEILAHVIDRDFYQPASAFADLARAQKLHSAIASGSKDANVNVENYEKALVEFFYLVQDLEAKFPDHVVTFEWYDTLYHRSPLLQIKDWRSQMFQLVYQMGALYCLKAQKEIVHAEEGIKRACVLLQAAAGCLQYILDQRTPSSAEIPGLDRATLSCLRGIMISEAQELTWRKAAQNSAMKDSVVARLAIKVSDLYADAAASAGASESVRQEWINHMNVKSLHFKAAAFYRMSINALDSFEYGVQVGFLRTADSLCREAQTHKRYVSEFVMEDLAGLSKTVADSLRVAEKDNDLVYLKPVPESHELPSIVGVSMVEPKVPSSILERNPELKPAFAKLMPFAVVQVSQAFRERQDAFVASAFHEPLQALNRMLRHFLAERQLPASLDTLQIPEAIPDSIIQHAQEIMSIGGIRIIENSMDEISILAANSMALVAECEERLNLEKKEDDLMRDREGTSRWTRTPSHVANASFHSRIEKMREYLLQGKQSDALLGEIYATIRDTLDVYCGGQKALLRCIPKNNHVELDKTGEAVAYELRGLLDEVTALETKRERFQSSIDLKSRNHSILSVVIDSYKRNPEKFQNSNGAIDQIKFEPVYEKHITYFNSDLAYLAQSKESQATLEEKIETANARFGHVKEVSLSKIQGARLNVLQALESGYVKYLELVQNLNQASKFYTSFLDRGHVVLKELDAFLHSRREEARELALNIRDQRNFEGIEQSMARNPGNLVAPRSVKPSTWDPSKGIKFA